MSYLNIQLGQIATQLPGATAIFFANKINFCCNGDKTLQEILHKKKLDPTEIVNALEELAKRKQPQQDWSQVDKATLIEHILARYHHVHRQQLSELVRLAARVETVHGDHELCPNGLADHLANMQHELEEHMQKEENILFPMLASNNPMAAGPISVMMSDHEHHKTDIAHIYALSNELSLHPQACNTWRALYLGLEEFICDINMHIHLENTILFAPAQTEKAQQNPVGIMSTEEMKKAHSPDFCCGSCS